mgnify:CR=1 FL=1
MKEAVEVIIVMVLAAAFSQSAWAGRPCETEGPGVTPQGAVEMAIGTEYASGAVVGKSFEAGINFAYGLAENVEVDVCAHGIVYSSTEGDETSGLEDGGFFAKWRFFGSDESDSAAAVFGAVSMPTGDENEGLGCGTHDGSLGLTYSQALGGGVTTYVNGVYSAAQHGNGCVTLGVALEKEMSEKVVLVCEYVTDKGTGGGKDEDSDRVLAGAVINATEKLAVDVGLKWGLDNRTADITVITGITYAF